MIYWFPNRPTLRPVDPRDIINPTSWYMDSLEATGRYVAEKKFNGDNVLIYTDNIREFWNRHHERHHYVPTTGMLKELAQFPPGSIINGELMHYKFKGSKNLLIVHCIMKWKGELLQGKTWGESRAILDKCDSGECVKISQVYTSGFWDLYQSADGAEIEGIILKDPTAKLVFSTTKIPDVPWMLKFRKKSKKYSF